MLFSPFIINIITISILEEEIGVSQGSISKESLKRENEKKMKILVRENTFFSIVNNSYSIQKRNRYMNYKP